MKEKIKRISLVLSAVLMLSFTALGALGGTSALAVNDLTPPTDDQASKKAACQGSQIAIEGVDCEGTTTNVDSVFGWVGTVTTWILWAVGAVCVIFIIFGGIRYATSGGDSEKVKKAKDTLLYAIIGLAVALLASLIVSLLMGAANDLNMQ
jgi:hypothetical protein